MSASAVAFVRSKKRVYSSSDLLGVYKTLPRPINFLCKKVTLRAVTIYVSCFESFQYRAASLLCYDVFVIFINSFVSFFFLHL